MLAKIKSDVPLPNFNSFKTSPIYIKIIAPAVRTAVDSANHITEKSSTYGRTYKHWPTAWINAKASAPYLFFYETRNVRVSLHKIIDVTGKKLFDRMRGRMYISPRVAVVFAQFRYSFHASVTLNRTRPIRSHHREKLLRLLIKYFKPRSKRIRAKEH